MVASAPGRTTVYLHIGPPKTGTTYIQDVLRYWHKELKDAHVLFPGIPRHDHFSAALDVRGKEHFGHREVAGIPRGSAPGAWARLVRKARGFAGTVIISHEVFASADDEHAAAAVRDLAGTDLHLVVTARDPERQLVSSWQERIKHGNPNRFKADERVLEPVRSLPPIQRLPDLLDRWGATLAADQVHVVTVPPASADPTLLWRRFATTIGIDPERFDPSHAPRSNKSLGIVEIEVLRRVNLALDGRLPYPGYARFVNRLYASQILAQVSQQKSVAPALPEHLQPIADQVSDLWVEHIKQRGYKVCGDLDDLRPRHLEGLPPDAASEADVAEAAVQATANLLLELSRLQQPREIVRRLVRDTGASSLSHLQGVTHRLKWSSHQKSAP